MLFTWDWHNSCVVYLWWHVKTFPGFVGTLFAIALLSMAYEFLRNWIARYKSVRLSALPVGLSRFVLRELRLKLAVLYAFQVGFLFMLMLVFMTYNGWYMLAVVAGAAAGYYTWGDETEAKAMVCH